jgi:hypothetical protein
VGWPVTNSKTRPDVFNPLKDDFASFEGKIYAKHQFAAEEELIDKTPAGPVIIALLHNPQLVRRLS